MGLELFLIQDSAIAAVPVSVVEVFPRLHVLRSNSINMLLADSFMCMSGMLSLMNTVQLRLKAAYPKEPSSRMVVL
jgi:hypothetical protein